MHISWILSDYRIGDYESNEVMKDMQYYTHQGLEGKLHRRQRDLLPTSPLPERDREILDYTKICLG